MDQPDVSSFEDRALKAALRRKLCGECAPSRLRQRIARCLASEGTAGAAATAGMISGGATSGTMRISPPASDSLTLPSLLPGLAIAAAMLIAIGSIALILGNSSQALPQNFETAAIFRHDGCCKAPDHHQIVKASFGEIGKYLRQELQHPILAADMTQDGWTFSGAAICPVNGVLSAHLLFRKGPETLSVFSLPASAVPSLGDNQTYEASTVDGHSVVARAQDGAIYCLVGHCPQGTLTCEDLDRLMEEHRGRATVAAVAGPRITVAGILREP